LKGNANLIDNAMKFTPGRRQIIIKQTKHHNEIEITVADTGIVFRK
jgi:signal transduction histidine kinase